MMILNTLSEKKNQKVKGYLGWLKVNLMGQFMKVKVYRELKFALKEAGGCLKA